MSIEALTWAWETEAVYRDKIVLLALSDYANHNWEAWPSHATLARKCGMSSRTIVRCLGSLEDAGLITKTTSTGTSNTYRIGPESPKRTSDQFSNTTANQTPPPMPTGQGTTANWSNTTANQTPKPYITIKEPKKKPKQVRPSVGSILEKVPIPDTLQSLNGFSEAWSDWVEHRLTLKAVKDWERLFRIQLKDCETLEDPIRELKRAHGRQWTDFCFPNTPKKTQKTDMDFSQCFSG